MRSGSGFAILCACAWWLAAADGHAAEVGFRDRCLADIVRAVAEILASQDPRTGRFGAGIWLVTDQDVMLPLAAAWATKGPGNPYYRNPQVLQAIMAAGDALIADQDETGQWEFRKKDGSTWGKIYMPWTYSRWIRSYGLIRDAMPPERRERWVKGLRLGFAGISRDRLRHVHNIPSHLAMALYFAGRYLDEPAWMEQAAEFMHKVVAAQHPDGYWSEHSGPVINYGFVYVDAVGTYYAASGDAAVLPALRKSAIFHMNFTYPDGTPVETVDERNPYHAGHVVPNAGFTVTAEGRAYVAQQLRLQGDAPIAADYAASLLLYGKEGPGLPAGGLEGDHDFVLGQGSAAVRRRGPWFLVVSAMTCPVANSRWIQDRQNLFSVYHDKVGLVLGGGNTKLQPGWSTFTVGDPTLLSHRQGDEEPKFQPPPGILHVPTGAKLVMGDALGLDLEYGEQRCSVRIKVIDARHAECIWSATGPCEQPVAAHLTVLPRLKGKVARADGKAVVLGGDAFAWPAGAFGQWIEHAGFRLNVPTAAGVRWPVLPHNPYRKDGRAEASEGRLVIDLPFSSEGGEQRIGVEIP